MSVIENPLILSTKVRFCSVVVLLSRLLETVVLDRLASDAISWKKLSYILFYNLIWVYPSV